MHAKSPAFTGWAFCFASPNHASDERNFMKILCAGIAALCVLVSSSSMAGQADLWKQAYQFPHLTQEYKGCENLTLVRMKKLFQARGIPDSAFAASVKSFYSDGRASELVRPFVQGESVLIGLNMRWLGNRLCPNPVLACQSSDKGTCSEMSFVAPSEVLQPLLVSDQTIIARRDNFTSENLNPDPADFVFSNDKGKSWARVNSPVSCADLGTLCRLIPQTVSRYFLMSSRVSDDSWTWTDMAIHFTTDAGKSWTLLTEKWQGIHDSSAVSFADDTFVSVRPESGEFVTLSRLKPLDNKIEELKTSIRTTDWNPRSDGKVLDFKGDYLVRLNAADGSIPARRFGVFLVPANGDSAPSKLIWQANGVEIGDILSSEGVIAIRTWTPRSRVAPGKFAEQIHYSLDGGKTWKIDDVPADLLGGVMRLANRKVWLFTSNAVKYRDLSN